MTILLTANHSVYQEPIMEMVTPTWGHRTRIALVEVPVSVTLHFSSFHVLDVHSLWSPRLGIGLGGIPTNVPYANCKPLGLVGIIQEGNRACPDDTAKGGFITFQFREPIDYIKLISLLDVDEGSPDIKLTYDAGKTNIFDTPVTGNNGFLSFPFNTFTYKKVTSIEIKYFGSGSINSLVYPYCPQTPTPKIAIKKFAGPPGLCTATGITSMQDDVYTVPSTSASWAYCYEITVPSTSDECLYDVVLDDPAPIGGTTGPKNVTKPNELLCPGQTVYVAGDTKSGSLAPEASFTANVDGYGYYSSIKVSSQDPASVRISAATPAPV